MRRPSGSPVVVGSVQKTEVWAEPENRVSGESVGVSTPCCAAGLGVPEVDGLWRLFSSLEQWFSAGGRHTPRGSVEYCRGNPLFFFCYNNNFSFFSH